MKREKIYIDGIPAIIWGEKSDKAYIYVHGKMQRKEDAEDFAEIAERKGYQTISFDLPEHGERKNENYPCNIWNGICDLNKTGNYVFDNWGNVFLYGCSLGAYFALNAYCERNIEKCLFLSPVVDMEFLIHNMFKWFNVTEEELFEKKEIETPVDILSWDYYRYVCENPVRKWDIPTYILYGENDNMQSPEVIKKFAEEHNCKISISENSEHSFMSKGDKEVLMKWLSDNV